MYHYDSAMHNNNLLNSAATKTMNLTVIETVAYQISVIIEIYRIYVLLSDALIHKLQ